MHRAALACLLPNLSHDRVEPTGRELSGPNIASNPDRTLVARLDNAGRHDHRLAVWQAQISSGRRVCHRNRLRAAQGGLGRGDQLRPNRLLWPQSRHESGRTSNLAPVHRLRRAACLHASKGEA